MERLGNDYVLNTPPGTFPLSTDSMVLSDFVRLPKSAKILDLGSGCGTLGILLCAGDTHCHVTGVELDEASHLAALENIHENKLSQRMESICGDLRSVSQLLPKGSFTTCVSNPPYFSGGFLSQTLPLARQNDCCSADDLIAAASYGLQYGGDFFLVQKPENLAQLCANACKYALEPKRLRLVRHRPSGDISMILLQCRKGAKPGLIIEELTLFNENGAPTEEYRKIYHL